jgi:hypothetical protein
MSGFGRTTMRLILVGFALRRFVGLNRAESARRSRSAGIRCETGSTGGGAHGGRRSHCCGSQRGNRGPSSRTRGGDASDERATSGSEATKEVRSEGAQHPSTPGRGAARAIPPGLPLIPRIYAIAGHHRSVVGRDRPVRSRSRHRGPRDRGPRPGPRARRRKGRAAPPAWHARTRAGSGRGRSGRAGQRPAEARDSTTSSERRL